MSNVAPLRVGQKITPTPVKPKVRRKPNANYRSREHLLESEVDTMVSAIGKVSRYPVRDRALIVLAYQHGLRLKELLQLKWSDVDFNTARLNVRRVKNGLDTTHPIQGDTLRLLRKLKRLDQSAAYVFMTERGSPLSPSTLQYMVRKAGEAAGIEFPVHPHMLRHGTGYYLANKGVDTRVIQDYLGHKSIQHTVRYTQLAANRFDGLWD